MPHKKKRPDPFNFRYGNSETAPASPYGYAGMRYAAEFDGYRTPNRVYSPRLGRWLQSDPLGTTPNPQTGNVYSPLKQYSDGMNLYAYVGNEPVNGRDEWGLSIAQWIVDILETDTGDFLVCVGDCLDGATTCPRLVVVASSFRIPKIAKGAKASTKSIWEIKAVRNITGTTIKTGMKLGRYSAAGVLIGGAYDIYRIGECVNQCSKE